jgi:hypothetical protein
VSLRGAHARAGFERGSRSVSHYTVSGHPRLIVTLGELVEVVSAAARSATEAAAVIDHFLRAHAVR